MELKKLFEDNLPLIEGLMSRTCRNKRFSRTDCEDFRAWAFTRIIENDYRKLGGYRGRGPLKCFLAAVVARLGMDYCDKLWGKWRPTATARQLGLPAIELERLLIRDQVAWSEAVQLIAQSQGTSESKLETFYGLLPNRPPRRFEDEESLRLVAAPQGNPQQGLLLEEKQKQWKTVQDVLEQALAKLPTQERLIVKLHFEDGLPLSKIRQMLDLPENIYHLKDRILKKLQQDLKGKGVQPEVISLLFDGRLE